MTARDKAIINAMRGLGYTASQVRELVKRERAVFELACVVNKPVSEITYITQGWSKRQLREAYERAARGDDWLGRTTGEE